MPAAPNSASRCISDSDFCVTLPLAAGILLTRRRIAINHGKPVQGTEEEKTGFTRDCITERTQQLPGVTFYNVATDISCVRSRVQLSETRDRGAHLKIHLPTLG